MLFNSYSFVYFFVVFFPLYWVLPHRGQNLLILAASYFFYSCWDPRFLGLLVASTVVDYALALAVYAEGRPGRRKLLLAASMALNLGFLGFFKYYNFFAESLQSALRGVGWEVPLGHLNVVLPVGISFYTFQSMSYVIDAYRREIVPTRNLIQFAAFVSFFPHLVAGPIMRPTSLLPQIEKPRTFRGEQFQEGCSLIFWGLVKKCVIADNLALIVDDLFARPAGGLDSGLVFVAMYAFAFQIYCDFSGYTDIARGVSKTIGFELALNFNLPFLAANPKELWARWHISLSSWLRDYLYIPLGGSRGGLMRTCRNLMITMTLCGLWHGASWSCVVWGAFCGAWLCAHRAVEPWLRRVVPEGGLPAAAWHLLAVIATFHLFAFGVALLRTPSLAHYGAMLEAMVMHWSLPSREVIAPVAAYCLPLLCVQVWEARAKDLNVFLRSPWPLRSLGYAAGFYAMVILGEYGGTQFYYFQF